MDQLLTFRSPAWITVNNPIPIEKVSCRVLTDTHRRALCACAAFTFGLGFELWAKAEVADAQEAEQPAPARQASSKKQINLGATTCSRNPYRRPAPQPRRSDALAHLYAGA